MTAPGARDQVGGGEIVGQHLEHRRRAEFAGVEHSTAEGGEYRQHPFEDVSVTTGENGDVAGSGDGSHRSPDSRQVTHRFRSPWRRDASPRPHRWSTSPPRSSPAESGEQPVLGLHDHADAAGDGNTMTRSHCSAMSWVTRRTLRRRRRRAARPPDRISDHQVVAAAQQRTGELAAHIAETDEPTFMAVPCCWCPRWLRHRKTHRSAVSTMLFA